MAPKKNIANPSTGKGEFIEYDDKRLRHMSADELRDYYDRVEPLSNDEVDEIYDRIIPKITYEIASSTQQEKPRRLRSSITKIILIAVCLTLMLSVVAQALGVPVWETIVTWTKDTFQINATRLNVTSNITPLSGFSNEEQSVWGDDTCKAFADAGIFPALPRFIPHGFKQSDLYYMTNGAGYFCIDALYKNADDHSINLVVDLYTSMNYSYTMTVEHDDLNTHEITIHDITYRFASNLNNNTVAWNDQYGSYCISGNIDMSILEEMIRSIVRDR